MSFPIFAPRGPLALAQHAFGMVIVAPPEPPRVEDRNGVHVLAICGPLDHHKHPHLDNYEAILARASESIAKRPRALVLRIDSPGGLVAGCIETAQSIRALAAAANVPVLAYIDGQACSAGYALACAADRICLPATGAVGSIGVIETLVDATKQDAAMGLRFELVASGARKADGNPHSEITDAVVESALERVNALAGVFFDFVAERRAIDVSAVRALEARIVHGHTAVRLGLASEVSSFDQLLASIASQPRARARAAKFGGIADLAARRHGARASAAAAHPPITGVGDGRDTRQHRARIRCDCLAFARPRAYGTAVHEARFVACRSRASSYRTPSMKLGETRLGLWGNLIVIQS